MRRHKEKHLTERIGWLRAAVLGANDGIVSTASLVIGIASSGAGHHEILLAGIAGLVAGALSMAAGEYVSVSSQEDTEQADLAREKEELTTDPHAEELELAGIYRQRGLNPELAISVAHELMKHDALGAHARDELGLSEITAAKPLQAAMSSAASFTAGAAVPILTSMMAPQSHAAIIVSGVSLICLVILGAIAANAGGASAWTGAARVGFWGTLAMAVTAAVGKLFGTAAG